MYSGFIPNSKQGSGEDLYRKNVSCPQVENSDFVYRTQLLRCQCMVVGVEGSNGD
jgi:hypothetical protein